MEERKVRSILVACMLFGLISGKLTAATFKECYEGCFILCAIIPGNSIPSCAFKCLKDCIFPSTPLNSNNNREETQQHFCKLGCAFSLCSNISSKSNPGGEKVESCVNSCSGRCTNKNH